MIHYRTPRSFAFLLLILLLAFPALSRGGDGGHAAPSGQGASARRERAGESTVGRPDGVHFHGSLTQIARVKSEMAALLKELGFTRKQVAIVESDDGTDLRYGLATPRTDTDTLHLKQRPQLKLVDETIEITDKAGKKEKVSVPSRKEILAALMQHGRSYDLSGSNCSVTALRRQIGVRQNIALWAKKPRFITFATGSGTSFDPDAGWRSGWSVAKGTRPSDAVADVFIGDTLKYRNACAGMCKLIMVQGIMDYYGRVAKDEVVLRHLNTLADGRPLKGIEPSVDGTTIEQEGKYLDRQFNVPWNNWIPGDWGWFMNPDDKSSEIPGHEGSNVIYIGDGRFAELYLGGTGPTFDEKVGIIHGWGSAKPLDQARLEQMRKDPRDGGSLRDVRDVPKPF